MRSVKAKILLWCFGTLLLCLAAFVAVSMIVSYRSANKGRPFDRFDSLHMEDAREAYETGGAKKLAEYIQRVSRFLPGEHFLTDAAGRDLVTGEDRAELLRRARTQPRFPFMGTNQVVVARHTPDGRYRWIIVLKPRLNPWDFAPYYTLILILLGVLCWTLAANIASPLRTLARTVDRFGRGDLSVRIRSARRDEIGELARAFDQMAERIETLLTAERRLLQDISHELRSPLARLSFAAELTRTAVDRNAAAARLRKEIDRLTDLVSSLVEVTRAEADPSMRRLEEIALAPLLEDIAGDCELEAQGHGCRIHYPAGDDVRLRGDPELLRRAIENVLRNAIRYAPEATDVELTLKKSGLAAVVSIRDFGSGVPEELLPKIFQPFFRADDSRDSATGGVGLGLAIARRAVDLHRGQIEARRAHPGLLVNITLPVDGAA